MISSRKVTDLHPKAGAKCRTFVKQCRDQFGIDVLVYCTFRDNAMQNHLYAQGRTRAGRKVTNAKGGRSFHNWRVAWDCVPMLGGKPQWSDNESYKKMGAVAESLGIEWAGNWKSFKETAHFQFTNGKPLSYFQKGGTP